jgi:hypothetical protein
MLARLRRDQTILIAVQDEPVADLLVVTARSGDTQIA